MFDIGWSELVLIGAVALVVIGPKELPGMLRTVGGAVTKIRRMAAEFQGQISEAMREAEMADVKKTVDGLNDSVSSGTSFNPIQTIRDEIRNAVEGTNPASTASTTTAEPTISVPLPPPVPDLTPEQIAAAFAPVEPIVEATEPAKKKRVRKAPAAATPLDAGEDSSPAVAATSDAEAPAKPKRKAAKKATAVATDDEGTAG